MWKWSRYSGSGKSLDHFQFRVNTTTTIAATTTTTGRLLSLPTVCPDSHPPPSVSVQIWCFCYSLSQAALAFPSVGSLVFVALKVSEFWSFHLTSLKWRDVLGSYKSPIRMVVFFFFFFFLTFFLLLSSSFPVQACKSLPSAKCLWRMPHNCPLPAHGMLLIATLPPADVSAFSIYVYTHYTHYIHTTLYTHYTLHTTHYTLHTTHYTLHTTHYTLYVYTSYTVGTHTSMCVECRV